MTSCWKSYQFGISNRLSLIYSLWWTVNCSHIARSWPLIIYKLLTIRKPDHRILNHFLVWEVVESMEWVTCRSFLFKFLFLYIPHSDILDLVTFCFRWWRTVDRRNWLKPGKYVLHIYMEMADESGIYQVKGLVETSEKFYNIF